MPHEITGRELGEMTIPEQRKARQKFSADQRALENLIRMTSPSALPGAFPAAVPPPASPPYAYRELGGVRPEAPKEKSGVDKLLDLLGKMWKGLIKEEAGEVAAKQIKTLPEYR